jgi:hypothetical protein
MSSDFDVLTRMVIPVLTFGLGILATFLAQRYWKNKDVTAESVKSLADLTADWYNQLDQLRNSLNADPIRTDPLKATELVDAYIRNRLILPKVLYHLAVLRERKAYPELIFQVERFLSTVTSYKDPVRSFARVQCRDLLLGRPTDAGAFDNFTAVLRDLDDHQQDVAREAARATH